MKKIILLIGFILLIVGTLFYINKKDQRKPLSVIQPTPTISDQNIRVTKPSNDEQVILPFIIRGEARVFENQLAYRLKDGEGKLLAEGAAIAHSPDVGQFGPFEIVISTLEIGKSKRGVLEVFSESAKDGSEINKIVIPIKF